MQETGKLIDKFVSDDSEEELVKCPRTLPAPQLPSPPQLLSNLGDQFNSSGR